MQTLGSSSVDPGFRLRIEGEVSFIGFAPVVHPRAAVAVTVECAPGQGGTVAAPIAKQVLEALLNA